MACPRRPCHQCLQRSGDADGKEKEGCIRVERDSAFLHDCMVGGFYNVQNTPVPRRSVHKEQEREQEFRFSHI
jgi:hypothetical protein